MSRVIKADADGKVLECVCEMRLLCWLATAIDATQWSRTKAGRIPYIEFLVLHSKDDHTCASIGLILIEPILINLVAHAACVDCGAGL